MIEGPRGPTPPSRGPFRGLSVERVVDWGRTVAGRLGRWLLPQQQHLETADPLLWRLRLIQRIVWVALAGLGIYLVFDLLIVRPQPPTMAVRSGGAPAGSEALPVEAGDTVKPPEAYRDSLVVRNPFGLSGIVIQPTEQEAAKAKFAELTSHLTVVGINRGRVPEALIEDTAAQRTYFVKVGDEINGLTIKAIDHQGVLVSYGHEETRLK